jgi:hypothetical protein
MERIKVIWTCTTDIICVPEKISKHLDEYTDDFLEWVSGTSFDSAIKEGTSFATEHYVYYLNDRFLSDNSEKAYIECENYVPVTKQEIQNFKKMRKIYF